MVQMCLWSLRYALVRWRALTFVLGLMLVKVCMDVLLPWPMKVLVDNVLADQPLPDVLAGPVSLLPGAGTREGLLVWCVGATVVLFLLGWAEGLAAALADLAFGRRLVFDLAGDLFAHLQRLSVRFHGQHPVGDTVRRVTSDCGCVATIVRDALLPLLTTAISLVAMFAILWSIDPVLTLLALAVVPCMVIVFHLYAGPMEERSYRQQEVEGGLYAVVEQTLSAIPLVQTFGREEHGDRRFREGGRSSIAATLKATSVQLQFKVLMGLATAAGTAAILWVGASHALEGRLSVGSVLVFLSYLGALYAPLEGIMYTSSTIQSATGSARRVREVLEAEVEVKDGPEELPAVRGHVRLEEVSFAYQPGRPVLRCVSLEALPGQTVAVVGYTGAGKTTLLSLVTRLFDPTQGRVLIDGHDLRTVRLEGLRRQVAVVLQEPFLFPLSVADNIAYGRPTASRAEIESAAQAANAHEFILALPHGYDTVIGERGATLSGGERQRLSIARALLKDAPVLILDEPTSALDAQTEGLLLEALQRLMHGRTTLLIAHRLSTVRDADRIVVLDQGQVVEQGSHDQLLAQGGLYARLYELQFGPRAVAPSRLAGAEVAPGGGSP
jgi:ATP-binding cassette subfamily B protein/subfamily B ATP-binding cassette protein MsbA